MNRPVGAHKALSTVSEEHRGRSFGTDLDGRGLRSGITCDRFLTFAGLSYRGTLATFRASYRDVHAQHLPSGPFWNEEIAGLRVSRGFLHVVNREWWHKWE